MYITVQEGAAADRGLQSGEVGRSWDDSNPRPSYSNATILSGPPSLAFFITLPDPEHHIKEVLSASSAGFHVTLMRTN